MGLLDRDAAGEDAADPEEPPEDRSAGDARGKRPGQPIEPLIIHPRSPLL
jgi:hypothetical protein